MSSKKIIDIKKTEETGADTNQYDDGSDLTHYLGNDENRSRKKIDDSRPKEDVGNIAHGNLKSTDKERREES